MSKCYSDDDKWLYWWVARDCGEVWNKFKPEKWRTFQLSSNSHKKSAARLSILLRQNAAWLDGSSRTSIDQLYEVFETKLIMSLAHIKREGEDKVNDILGSSYDMTLGFWAFLNPDLKNIHYLSCMALGVEPDETLLKDRDRRKEKATILREFHAEVKDWIKRAAYRVGSGPDSNRRLAAALEVGRQALAQADDVIDWEEG